MSHDAFLRDVCADPDDDSVRLIYADWLEDNGDSDRAELIRLQCWQEAMEPSSPEWWDAQARGDELLARHGERWKGDLPAWAEASGFRRGFVHEVRARIGDWNAHAGDLLRVAPVTALDLVREGEGNDLAAVEPAPSWGRLRRLTAWWVTTHPAALARFFRNPHLRSLRSLVLGFDQRHHQQPTSGMGDALAAALELPTLEELSAGSVRLGPAGVARLFAAKPTGPLRKLGLGFTGFDDSCAELLARWEGLAGLTDLALGTNEIGPAGLRTLIHSPAWGKLKSLSLHNNRRVGDEGVRELAVAPGLENLRRLDLDQCSFTAAGFGQLLRALPPGRLRYLQVSNNQLGDEGLWELAASPLRHHLTGLDLSQCGFTAEGFGALLDATADMTLCDLTLGGKEEVTPAILRRLAACAHLGRLRNLWVQEAACGPEGAKALAAAPWVGSLRSLVLLECDLGNEGAAALADAPLHGLRNLNVFDPTVTEAGHQRLRDRFGAAYVD